MAGILDVFFPQPGAGPLAGVLTDQDRRQAMFQGLGALGMGLLAAGQPTTDPRQRFQGIMGGLQGFGQARQGALDQALRERLAAGQIDAQTAQAALAKAKFDAEQQQMAQRAQYQQGLAAFLGVGGGEQGATMPQAPQAQQAAFPGQMAAGGGAQAAQPAVMQDPAQLRQAAFMAVQAGNEGVASALMQRANQIEQTAADATKPTPLRADLDFAARSAGMQPGTPAYNAFMAEGLTKARLQPQSQTTVNVANGGAKKFGEQLGERFANQLDDLQKAALAATENDAVLDEVASAMDGVRTGAFAEGRLALGRAMTGLGVDPAALGVTSLDEIGSAEALRSATTKLTMNVVQQSKGAISDKEMAMFEQAVPRLSATPQGNQMIVDFAKRANARARELNERAGEIAMKIEAGEMTVAQGRRLLTQERDKPLFTGEERKMMREGPTAPPPAIPPGPTIRAGAVGAGAMGAPRVLNKADFDRLPSGATFIAPDGYTRRKP